MKTCSIEINKETYTLALTMDAFTAITDKIGGAQNFGELFKTKPPEELCKETLFLLSVLLEGGRNYALLVHGREEKQLSLAALGTLYGFADVSGLRMKIFETIALGMGREVEVETDRKNAETTQMNP